jgi:glycosyltransferase involved in cell wall biosynthesis
MFACQHCWLTLNKINTAKIFEYLACEKPVMAGLAGEIARVLHESSGGLVVAQGKARSLADTILELNKDPELRMKMGKPGRSYVEQNFSRLLWAARLEEEFNYL